MEYIEIGSTPAEEECAQVGSPGYAERAKAECRVFVKQLERHFGKPPQGAALRIKANMHDFGMYYEVAVAYDPNVEAAVEYAFKVEGETPGEWDSVAKLELTPASHLPKLTVGDVLDFKK